MRIQNLKASLCLEELFGGEKGLKFKPKKYLSALFRAAGENRFSELSVCFDCFMPVDNSLLSKRFSEF